MGQGDSYHYTRRASCQLSTEAKRHSEVFLPSSPRAYLDDELKITIDPVTNFWNFAGLDDSIDNPWTSGSKMAPFDQKVRFCYSSTSSLTLLWAAPVDSSLTASLKSLGPTIRHKPSSTSGTE
ncbi:Beta-1,3-glucan-binding protein [Portunus trituberculatus]|uniref:Beta-1,3-glucan-binding protein n=1 Tax=Portunus trituberculatus TaxID=210409 RepID=A0A5B7K0Q2_PORTR|nr:Beta-1,3-glucan-binding protein [Portunus trituberculatus]